jgi:predicted enzyme related to lactoylglutathione lyase
VLSHFRVEARHVGMNTFHSVIYTVSNLATAKAVHGAVLGVAPHTDQPYYVGFNVGGFEIGLVPQTPETGKVAPLGYVQVDDIDTVLGDVEAAGATVIDHPHDVGGGTRLATVADENGNVLGLLTRS